MAGLGARLFPAFSKLTAAQVNGYLMDQSIMRFASAAVRDAAFGGAGEPTLAEGMTCYLDDTNEIQSYNGSAWVTIASSSNPLGLVYVGGTSFTAASTASPVNLDSVFSATYQNYKIEILITASSQVMLQYRLRVGGASNNTSNYGNQTLVADNTTIIAARTTSQNIGDVGQMVLSGISFMDITVFDPFSAAPTGMLTNTGSFVGEAYMRNQVNVFKASTSFDGISFIPVSGTITGTVRVYGYRNQL